MYNHDSRQRNVGVLGSREDRSFRSVAVVCAATTGDVTFIALCGGMIQGIAGPLKQQLFSIRCETRGEVARLEYMAGYEVLLSVEGLHRGELCMYQCEKKGFGGTLISSRVKAAGGGVIDIAFCEHSGKIAVATQRVVTLFQLTRNQHSQGHSPAQDWPGRDGSPTPPAPSSLRPHWTATPICEVHHRTTLRKVSILGTTLALATSSEVWCVSIEREKGGDRRGQQGGEAGEAAQTPPAARPLSESTPRVEISDTFVEVKFNEKADVASISSRNSGKRNTVSDAGSVLDAATSLPYFDVAQSAPYERYSALSGKQLTRSFTVRHAESHDDGLPGRRGSHRNSQQGQGQARRAKVVAPASATPPYDVTSAQQTPTAHELNMTFTYRDGESYDISGKSQTALGGVPFTEHPVLFFDEEIARSAKAGVGEEASEGPGDHMHKQRLARAGAHKLTLRYHHRAEAAACGVVQHVALIPHITSEHLCKPPRMSRHYAEGDEREEDDPSKRPKGCEDLGPATRTEIYDGVSVEYRLLVCTEAVGALLMLHEAGGATQLARYAFDPTTRMRYATNNNVFLFAVMRSNSLEVFPLHCEALSSKQGRQPEQQQGAAQAPSTATERKPATSSAASSAAASAPPLWSGRGSGGAGVGGVNPSGCANKLHISFPLTVPRVQVLQVNCCGAGNVFDSSSGEYTIHTGKGVFSKVNGVPPQASGTASSPQHGNRRASAASFNNNASFFAEPRSIDGASPTSLSSMPTPVAKAAAEAETAERGEKAFGGGANLFFPAELYAAHNPLSCCDTGLFVVNSNSATCHTVKQLRAEWTPLPFVGGLSSGLSAGVLESGESINTAPMGVRESAQKTFASAAEMQQESAATRMGLPIRVSSDPNCTLLKIAPAAVFMQDFFKEYQKLRLYEELPIHTLHLLYEGYLLTAASVSNLRLRILQRALSPAYALPSAVQPRASLIMAFPPQGRKGSYTGNPPTQFRTGLSGDVALSAIFSEVRPAVNSPSLSPDVAYFSMELELSNVRLLMESVSAALGDVLLRHEGDASAGRDLGSPRMHVPSNGSFHSAAGEGGDSSPTAGMGRMRASLTRSGGSHSVPLGAELEAGGQAAAGPGQSMASDWMSDRESCTISLSSVSHNDPLSALVGMAPFTAEAARDDPALASSPDFGKGEAGKAVSIAAVPAPRAPSASGASASVSGSASRALHTGSVSKRNSLFSAALFGDEEKKTGRTKRKRVVVNGGGGASDVYALMGVAAPGTAQAMSSSVGIVPGSTLSGLIQEPVGFAFSPWFFYAFSDRPLKKVTQMLGRDQVGVINYLHAVLFSPAKPRALTSVVAGVGAAHAQHSHTPVSAHSSTPPHPPPPSLPSATLTLSEVEREATPFLTNHCHAPLPPAMPEEHGNSILQFYASFACERLSVVMWRSWLGRARGGGRSYSPQLGAELLRSVINRRDMSERGGSGRVTEGSKPTTTHSLHTRSYDGSEPDDYNFQSEPLYVAHTPCFSDLFVLGYLLLESQAIADCVDVWSDIDGAALIELATSSPHLWYSDVHPHDVVEAPLAAHLVRVRAVAALPGLGASTTTAGTGDAADELAAVLRTVEDTEAALHLSLGAIGTAAEEVGDEAKPDGAPNNFNRTDHTIGCVFALYFPWLLVPLLRSLRDRHNFPISSALRILQLAPKARRGLLTLRFLTLVLPSPTDRQAAAPPAGGDSPVHRPGVPRTRSSTSEPNSPDALTLPMDYDGKMASGISVESCDDIGRKSAEPPEGDMYVSTAVQAYAMCVALREMVAEAGAIYSTMQQEETPGDDDDADDEELYDLNLHLDTMDEAAAHQIMPERTEPQSNSDHKQHPLFTRDESSDEEDDFRPATLSRFCLGSTSLWGMLVPLYTTPGLDDANFILGTESRPEWLNAMCEGTDTVEGPDTLYVALTAARRKQSTAALKCALHALHCIASRHTPMDAIAECIVRAAKRAADPTTDPHQSSHALADTATATELDGTCTRTTTTTSRVSGVSREAFYRVGLVTLASLLLAHRGLTGEAVTLLEGVVPPQVLLSAADHHCGVDAEKWRPLVNKMVACDGKTDIAFAGEVFHFLSGRLPYKSFLSLLPPEGNVRFFLPYITRAVDLHKASLLKERAMAAARANLSS